MLELISVTIYKDENTAILAFWGVWVEWGRAFYAPLIWLSLLPKAFHTISLVPHGKPEYPNR